MHVVFVNGPPGAGKDTAREALVDELGAYELKFSWPLKLSLPSMFGCSDPHGRGASAWQRLDNDKESPRIELMGMSWRQAQIWLSEDVMKPRFGEDVFGRIAVNWLSTRPSSCLVVISDSGFASEAGPVIEYAGRDNCLLLRVRRPGHDFLGDSRSYVSLPIRTFDVVNDAGLREYQDRIVATVAGWLEKA